MRPATRQLIARPLSLIGLLLAVPLSAWAQGAASPAARPLAPVIDEYVRDGLPSNLSLRAQSLVVARSSAALAAP